jgi:hypothetical protein
MAVVGIERIVFILNIQTKKDINQPSSFFFYIKGDNSITKIIIIFLRRSLQIQIYPLRFTKLSLLSFSCFSEQNPDYHQLHYMLISIFFIRTFTTLNFFTNLDIFFYLSMCMPIFIYFF